ncbi:hypothetical protein BN1723_004242 [Verticillium longisporum]|uniref:Pheromone receptor n=1 Tax=Verticillium longisporum TaxID=100787 RepID=A0A0G4M417_VERLO|nr:hypothetical protein BN1708_015395 [Verticillium longisporum]CRK36382.1 hypothetical protein BN1723_004242 [Verticillium longisporum]
MALSDPFSQTFVLIASDDVTEIPVAVADVNEFILYSVKTVINYGAQIGSSFILLLVLVCMTPSARFLKLSQWLHIAALTVNIIRMVLLTVFFTSSWNEFYTFFAGDYSRVAPQDLQCSVASEIASSALFIMVQAVLGLQAWATVNLLPAVWKWSSVLLSACVSFAAIGIRVASAVGQIRFILTLSYTPSVLVALLTSVMGGVSIFYYCALFNVKLVSHLVKNRTFLPTRRGLSAVEVLVITNGILMIIPVTFAGFGWRNWQAFEPGSLALTSVILFLPLGTLIAQRIATPESYYEVKARHQTCTGRSDMPFKDISQIGSDATESNAATSTVTSRIEAGRSRVATDPIDLELRRLDGYDAEMGVVRVNREFDRREDRV